jgi:hypothetical protein
MTAKRATATHVKAQGAVGEPIPADGLLHPVALASLAILLLNDHVLKVTAPSPLTGILSGLAGIIIFPLVLQAVWEMHASLSGRWSGPSASVIVLGCVATGIGYAAVEIYPLAADAYRHGLGALQWPASAVIALLGHQQLPPLIPVLAVSDPYDLLALPFLTLPWLLGRERASARQADG